MNGKMGKERREDMTDPYSRLAAALWFLSEDDLKALVGISERLAVTRLAADIMTANDHECDR
jgi:hypothetical protein